MRLEKALVACLLPFDQSRLFAVQRVRPAIDVALEKIASLGLLPRIELQVSYCCLLVGRVCVCVCVCVCV